MKNLALPRSVLAFAISLWMHCVWAFNYVVSNEQTSFAIMGTYHYAQGDVTRYRTVGDEAVRFSRRYARICFETEIASEADFIRAFEAMGRPSSVAESAEMLFPKDLLAEISQVFRENDRPQEQTVKLLQFRPYFAAFLLVAQVGNEYLRGNGVAMDVALRSAAKQDSRGVCYLEGLDDYFSPSTKVSLDSSIRYAQYGVNYYKCRECRRAHAEITRAVWDAIYLRDDPEFACNAEESYARANGLEDILKYSVFERNGRLVERIEQEVAGGSSVVFAVGALHLCGKGGILRMLQDKGYRVERLGLDSQIYDHRTISPSTEEPRKGAALPPEIHPAASCN